MNAFKTAISIKTKEGDVYRITTETLLTAVDRAEKYLKEAVRWSDDRDAHINSGSEEDMNTRRHDQWLKRNQFPTDVWFPIDNRFSQDDMFCVLESLDRWIEGTLADFERVYVDFDRGHDLDPTYMLFGVPIRQLSVADQKVLRELGAKFACRQLAAAAALN